MKFSRVNFANLHSFRLRYPSFLQFLSHHLAYSPHRPRRQSRRERASHPPHAAQRRTQSAEGEPRTRSRAVQGGKAAEGEPRTHHPHTQGPVAQGRVAPDDSLRRGGCKALRLRAGFVPAEGAKRSRRPHPTQPTTPKGPATSGERQRMIRCDEADARLCGRRRALCPSSP